MPGVSGHPFESNRMSQVVYKPPGLQEQSSANSISDCQANFSESLGAFRCRLGTMWAKKNVYKLESGGSVRLC